MKQQLQLKGSTNLSEQAYSIIKEKIVFGELKQGEVISISAIADILNISRTPVTNACQKLEMDKFLTIIPKQGIIINTLTIDDAREIYELRAAIETYSAKRVFEQITEEDITFLQESNNKLRECIEKRDNKEFMKEDTKFHKFLLDKYNNSQFRDIIDTLYDKAFLIGLKSCENLSRMEESLKEHESIVEAILNNDRHKTVDLIEANIMNGYINLTGGYILK